MGRIIFFEDFGGRDYGFFFGGGGESCWTIGMFSDFDSRFFKKKKRVTERGILEELVIFFLLKEKLSKSLRVCFFILEVS